MKAVIVALCFTLALAGNASAYAIGSDWTWSYDPVFPDLSPPYYLPPLPPAGTVVTIPADETIYLQGRSGLWIQSYGNYPPDQVPSVLGPFTMTLSQEISLHAGDVVTGSGKFATYDFPPFVVDRTFVSIDDSVVWSLGLANACEWIADPSFCSSQLALKESPWMSWSWVAPYDGTFTLALNVVNDDQAESSAYFSHIRVPEASTLLLMGVGLIATAALRRRLDTISGKT